MASNIVVTPSEERYTEACARIARELADYVYGYRELFEFEQVPMDPHEGVKFSVQYPESPVYISDSGDNTTGGAVGDHTILLREFLKLRDFNGRKVLVTSIWDENAVAKCLEHKEGDRITLSVGHGYDENTKAVEVTGTIKKIGRLFGYMGCEHDAVGNAVTISTENVDFVITNGGKNAYSDAIMQLVPHYAINLVTAEKRLLSEFTQGSAIEGIGNPQRFFTMLENLNIRLANTKAFQDHQHFEPQLLEKLAENQPLFMTEKDAVKCQAFAKENWWYIPVDAEIVEAENQGQKLPQLWEKIRHLV